MDESETPFWSSSENEYRLSHTFLARHRRERAIRQDIHAHAQIKFDRPVVSVDDEHITLHPIFSAVHCEGTSKTGLKM